MQVGTVVGAGVFGLPYALENIGTGLGSIYLLFCAMMILVVNLSYAEVILQTPGDHQLTGYGRRYLGKLGMLLASIALLTGSYGAMLAYTGQMGRFLEMVSPFGGSEIFYSLLIFLLGGVVAVAGLRRISLLESLLVPGIFILLACIAVAGSPSFSPSHIRLGEADWGALLAYSGVVLFALSGSSVLPEVEEVLREELGSLKIAIVWGTLLPTLFYLLFVMIIIGVSGSGVSEDAVTGLVDQLPPFVVEMGAILGLLTMFTSFLTLAFVAKEMFYRDLGVAEGVAWVLSLGPPMIFFLSGLRGFIRILQISGGVMGGVTGVLIILLNFRAKASKKSEIPVKIGVPRAVAALAGLFFLFIALREIVVLFR